MIQVSYTYNIFYYSFVYLKDEKRWVGKILAVDLLRWRDEMKSGGVVDHGSGYGDILTLSKKCDVGFIWVVGINQNHCLFEINRID